MNKARRRLQKQRKTRRQWEANFSFADYERSGVETSESIQRSTKVTAIQLTPTQAEMLKATAEKGVQHGWSTNLDGKTAKPRARQVQKVAGGGK